MKLSEILLPIVFYYASVVILGINCINLGLISPIEVVEEWGCHDTEIRLTCGHLDSKLAILEATFTPNCTNEDCLRLDIKRLARAFHTTPKPIIFSRKDETEAGRKFLEALKNAPLLPNENQEEVVVIDSAETFSEIPNGSNEPLESNLADVVTEQLNARKASLRASLEKLIIRYLRKLSPEENFDYEMHKRSTRFKRSSRRKRVKRLQKNNNSEHHHQDEIIGMKDGDIGNNHLNSKFNETKNSNTNDYDDNVPFVSNTANLRINLGERIIFVNETDPDELEYEERQKSSKETRQFCAEQRRKVSSLDRFDIEKSFKNESIEDYNIRRLINKRCSGKNHCSFIFNIDHPFSKVWESGTVRVKYICMDDFRINHYCGEHLDIGYELSPQDQMEQHGSSSTNMAGETVAETRVVRESSARDHSSAYHSVKILRADDSLDGLTNLELQRLTNQNGPPTLAPGALSDSRKRKIKIHNPVIEKSEIKDKGVYSQDFKVLKIIPSNIDDLNDLNKIGDQIYIRKDLDDEFSSVEDLNIQHQSRSSHSTTTSSIIPKILDATDSTHQQSSLPFAKPSATTYLPSDGTTTVLYYPAPNYPETPTNKEIDDNSSWLISTDEELNLFHLNNNSNGNISKFENYTITIREGDQYVIVFPTTTTTTVAPPLEGVFLPPDNLLFGKDEAKSKNETLFDSNTTNITSTTTTSTITSTTPLFLTPTLDTSYQIDDSFHINNKLKNLSNDESDTKFLLTSTITTANISAISSAISIDFSADLSSPTISTNATTITTTDMTSSTSSESTDFDEVFDVRSEQETTTATKLSHHTMESSKTLLENEIDQSRSTSTSSSQSPSTTEYSVQTRIDDGEKKITKIDLPDSNFYDEDVDNGSLDSFDDETDDYDNLRDLFPTRSTYTSIQKTVFRKPLLHGFIMTPGYPKFYIGEINCKWEIYAPAEHKIRLSILDISLRNPEPNCMDYVEIVDQKTFRSLFNSCSEEIRPIEVISDSHQIEVIVKTTTEFAYPKRGVLLQYSALGCVDPPLPADGTLVKKTETANYYECKNHYIFPDTLTSTRQLVCTERHTWNRILPDCIEELVIAQSGFVVDSFNTNSRKRPPEKTTVDDDDSDYNYAHPNLNNRNNYNSTNMPDKDADMVFDIIIPTLLIAGLFIVNGFVFAVIIYFRKRNKTLEGTNVELAEL